MASAAWGGGFGRRARMRERVTAGVQLVVLYAAAFGVLTFLSPGMVIGGGPLPKLLFLLRMALLVGLATGLLWMRGLGWRDVGLRRPGGWRVALMAAGGLAACFGAAFLVRLSQGTLDPHAGAAKDYAMFQPIAHRWPEYLFWLFAVWTTAAFGEEMLFRGFVLDALERVLGGGRLACFLAVLGQGALFGLLHLYQGVNGAEVAGALGVMLGFVWWVAGRNLWPGIVIHGLIDTAAMTVVFLGLLPK